MKNNQASAEHQRISQALLENNQSYLMTEYGSLATARIRLMNLEYFLNYGEWK